MRFGTVTQQEPEQRGSDCLFGGRFLFYFKQAAGFGNSIGLNGARIDKYEIKRSEKDL